MDAGPSRETVSEQCPFDEPLGGWLHPLESNHSYDEGNEYEVSETSMEEDSRLSIPNALCSLTATQVGEEAAPAVVKSPGALKDMKLKSRSL